MLARSSLGFVPTYTDEHVVHTSTSRPEKVRSLFTHGGNGTVTTHSARLRPPTRQEFSRKRGPHPHTAAVACTRYNHPEPFRSHPPTPLQQTPMSGAKRIRTQCTADVSQYAILIEPSTLPGVIASTRKPGLRPTRPNFTVGDAASSDGLILKEEFNWRPVFIGQVNFNHPSDQGLSPVPQREDASVDGSSPKYFRSHGSSAFDARESAKYVAKLHEQSEQVRLISNTPRETYQAHCPNYTGSEPENEHPNNRWSESGLQAQRLFAPRRLSLHCQQVQLYTRRYSEHRRKGSIAPRNLRGVRR
jgi:hypothetical protein